MGLQGSRRARVFLGWLLIAGSLVVSSPAAAVAAPIHRHAAKPGLVVAPHGAEPSVVLPPSGADYFTLATCRLLDTRTSSPLAGGTTTVIQVSGASGCHVPQGTYAVALDITVLNPTNGGYVELFNPDSADPGLSTVNFSNGQTRNSNAVVSVSATGTISVRASVVGGHVDLLLDLYGYFNLAPSVTTTVPASGATSVALNGTVTFNFNKAVNVTASAFTLECPTGTPVPFTLAPAPPGDVASFTLTPSANLPSGTVCTATAVAAQITDPNGIHPTADYSFSFTTDTPPTVTTTTPVNGATAVLASSTVTVNFNKTVNVTASAFKLECPTGTPAAFTLSPAPPGGVSSFTLTPSAPLPAGVTCTATVVASQVADTVAGTHMTADFVFSFTIDNPPTVTSTSPVNGATQVSPATTVSFTFNEAVNVTASAFKLECPAGTPVAFTLSPAPPGGTTTFTLTPSANLPVSTTCTATAVAAQITDLAGTHLAANYVFTFTTGTPPTVTSTVPTNGATAVLASTTVTVNFSTTVNVTAPGFKLECPAGTPQAFTLSPAAPGGVASFTLTPSAPLPAGTVCTVTVVASQIKDSVTGVNLAADYVFSFTVDTPPTVTTTSPVNGATSVALTSTVTFNFNKAVNVTASAFKLECPTGTPVAFTLAPAPPGGVASFTLTPSANLPSGTTCTATAVAAQIADLAGTHMGADFAFSFTTDTPPAVTTTVPTNGATAVLASSTVTINFNKTVNVTASAFKLECPTGTPAAFTISPAPPGGVASFTLTPSAPLPSGVTCTATVVANQVTDTVAGTPMAANFVFSFTVDSPPTVTATSPANGATQVNTATAVVFTFSQAVNVTASAFKLECPTGTPVAFTLSPAPPGGTTMFTLTPSAPLPAATTCTATAVASQIANLAGTHLAADFATSFTTGTPPAVTSTVPVNGATAVLASTTITVNFNEAVNVTAPGFKLECPSGTPVAFTLSPAAPGGVASFTLTPSAPLPDSTVCTVTVVAAQIQAAASGIPLPADYVFSFTVDTPPAVTTTVPANGANPVDPATTVTINFSEAVNTTASSFKLECPSGTPIGFTAVPASPGGVSQYVLHPSTNLPGGVTCTVTAVASQITDLAGTHLPSDFVFSFTIDQAPTVTSTVPTSGATSVSPASTVTFNFSEAVNVTASAFKLECPTGTPIAFTLAPAPPGGVTSFVLTPSASLPEGTVCTATAVAAQITDVDFGQHMAADYVFSFTTIPRPAVTSTVPTNGATQVSTGATVTINFNVSVSVTGTAFKLECPTGTPEAFTVSPAGPASSYVLTPTAALPGGAVCTVTVVAAQVTDAFSQHPAADFTSSFTVDVPATVTSTVPTNGATSVAQNSTVSITFSKAVTQTPPAFKLECPAGTPQAFTVTPASPATTFVLHPTANLPADTTCTVTVLATQIADAAGSLMVANYVFTFSTPPLAVNDTYPQTVIGNVSINSALIPYSVTTNDVFNLPITITAFDATSANGGTVSMTTSGAGIGQFTYNPAAGFHGTDTFTYTISNAHGSTTATVSVPVAGMIWFINDNAGAGDGRLATPFNTLASFQAVNDGVGHHPSANDNIFLYDSSTGYTGPVTLLNGQKLIGQDATSSLSAISGLTPGSGSAALPATGGGSPNKVSITSAGNGVTLGSGNTVWGMTLGNATGTDLIGASVGSLKIRDLTINTTGAAVSLASGALDAIVNAISSGGGTHGISLTTTTGSFDVEGGGASDPANTTKGRTTAKNGGGTITLGSGGTIQNATSAGVLLSSATNVTLRNMVIQNNGGAGINSGGDGIAATNGSALNLDNDLIQGQTGNNGVHGTGVAGIAFQHTEVTNNASAAGTAGTHVWNVRIDSGTGTSTAANSLFHNSLENIFGVSQTGSATMTLNVTNSQFSDTATTASGNVGLQVNLQNTSNVTLSVDGSTFLRNRTNGIQYLANDSTAGSDTVTNSSFDQNAIDIDLAHQGSGQTVSFNFSNNSMRQTVGGLSASISVALGTGSTATTLLQGKILNNTIGNSGVADSGSMQGSGIAVAAGGAGTFTAKVDGNTVVQVDNEGFNAVAAQGSGTFNLTVTNNHFSVDTASPNSDYGAMIVDGGVGTDSQTLCLHMSGNTDAGNAAQGAGGVALLTELGNPTFNLQGYGGAANNAGQITTFIDGSNTDTPAGGTLVSPGAGTMKAAPANCPTPP